MIFPWHFPWESMEISAMQHGCSKGPGWFHQPKKGRYVSAHGVPHLFRCLGLGVSTFWIKNKNSAPRVHLAVFFLICQEVADVARLLLDKPRAYHLQKMILQTWPQVVLVWLAGSLAILFSQFLQQFLQEWPPSAPCYGTPKTGPWSSRRRTRACCWTVSMAPAAAPRKRLLDLDLWICCHRCHRSISKAAIAAAMFGHDPWDHPRTWSR